MYVGSRTPVNRGLAFAVGLAFAGPPDERNRGLTVPTQEPEVDGGSTDLAGPAHEPWPEGLSSGLTTDLPTPGPNRA